MSVEKFAVFGGTGFIGTHLREKLTQDRTWYTNRNHTLDSNQKTSTLAAYYLTHSGASGGFDLLEAEFELILNRNLKLLEASIKATPHTKNFIFISSGGTVYGNAGVHPILESSELFPISAYGKIKKAQEKWLTEYANKLGIPYTILRPANIYGPGQKNNLMGSLIENLKQQQAITIFGKNGVTRDFLFIDDLIEALVKVGSTQGEGKVFNLGTGIGTNTIKLVNTIEKMLNLENKSEILFTPERAGDVKYNVLDSNLFQKSFHWKPNHLLMDGLKKTL